MNNKSKQTLTKVTNYKNYTAVERKKVTTEKPVDKKPDKTVNIVIENRMPIVKNPGDDVISVSAERLQEAIIWSEILDKPLCKRRKRR